MALHFVQVEVEFMEGPEAGNAAAELGLDVDAFIGKTARVWGWSLIHAAPRGIVRGAGVVPTIERVAGWNGAPGAFVSALQRAGVLDLTEDRVTFRGWVKRYGKVLREQEYDRNRKNSSGRNSGRKSTRTSGRTSAGESDGMLLGSGGNHQKEDFRPKTLDQPPPTPSLANGAGGPGGLAWLEEQSFTDTDRSGVPRHRTRDVVHWQPTEDGCWEMIQLERVLRDMPREAKRPSKFSSWYVDAEPDGPDVIQHIVQGYLDDRRIETEGHPTALLIKSIYSARRPSKGRHAG